MSDKDVAGERALVEGFAIGHITDSKLLNEQVAKLTLAINAIDKELQRFLEHNSKLINASSLKTTQEKAMLGLGSSDPAAQAKIALALDKKIKCIIWFLMSSKKLLQIQKNWHRKKSQAPSTSKKVR